jgi:hypothetical protein
MPWNVMMERIIKLGHKSYQVPGTGVVVEIREFEKIKKGTI